MVVKLRSTLLICAALSASSVAPAQVRQTSEPLVPQDSTEIASVVIPERLPSLGDEVTPQAQASQTPQTSAPDDQTPEPVVSTVDRGEDLASLVADMRSSDAGSREVECLAAGIYFESKSEPLTGQLAVGQVIANRVKSGRFADSYCGVLFQRGQFSFIRGHSWPSVSYSNRQWQTAVAIAKIVDGHLKESTVHDALYFHARRVHPSWHFHEVASIGNHVFFR